MRNLNQQFGIYNIFQYVSYKFYKSTLICRYLNLEKTFYSFVPTTVMALITFGDEI